MKLSKYLNEGREITLYRIIGFRDEDRGTPIDYNNLGVHYTRNKKLAYNPAMWDYIGLEQMGLTDIVFVVAVKTPEDNIDYSKTAEENAEQEWEEETTIKDPRKITVVKTEKIFDIDED